MDRELETKNKLVFSYLTLRKVIGLLGLALPFVVSIGGWIIFKTGIQSSISSYYHTGMRDVFVGAMWATGFFMLSYKGYRRVDDRAGNLACLFAVGLSLFPTAPDVDPSQQEIVIGYVHLAFAAAFFLTLAYFSYFLFTRSDPKKKPTAEKINRNRLYKTCGIVMVACLLLMGLYALLPNKEALPLQEYNPVFWLEAIAIVAFGISWLTKGEALLKDKEKAKAA